MTGNRWHTENKSLNEFKGEDKMKKYGAYTEEVKTMVKDKFIDITRDALTDYDPETDDAKGLVAAIGSMLILADEVCKELDKEKENATNDQ